MMFHHRVKVLGKRGLVGLGLWRPIPAALCERRVAERLPYLGDAFHGRDNRPVSSPAEILDFAAPRPAVSRLRDLRYTPLGLAWHRGAIEEAASFSPIGPPFIEIPYLRPLERIAAATVVQTDHTVSYGDWVFEVVRRLVAAGALHGPLLLPRALAAKGYVRADLERLGIAYRAVTRPLLIGEALVLHKQHMTQRWTAEEVGLLRRRWRLAPPEPRPGSLLYLSREDVRSEVWSRSRAMPHAEIGALVAARGGRVVRTGKLRFEDYTALAAEAETVVADHGSAMVNLVQWRTRAVIELVSDGYWGAGLMALGRAAGVGTHAILRANQDLPTLLAKLEHLLDTIGRGDTPGGDGEPPQPAAR
ncbi:hypothetical protein LNKW23_19080 [Paralimibaculum aggregatum]|uniref:Glycosyltransferase family 61 protein n=1 Tax=Paralimibaculum aggregatum TaxID=3036245 RepID=A0ABQ6LHD4_9RHOB|nr:glycosyltransferase 61 family protein [Limibaculum sp. NKW23]GMG82695.1 hypothetical protein LNKW23_19080 [Limibaculum sp. NKW23]